MIKNLINKPFELQNPFAEHIIFSFPENIISRFDVAVNDVAEEFAEKLQSKIFYFEMFCCKMKSFVLYYSYYICIGRCIMAVSYKKLWILLIEKNMKKTDLRIQSGISTGALAKLGKNENVNTEVLAFREKLKWWQWIGVAIGIIATAILS